MPKDCVRGGWHLERELRQNVWVVKLQYVNRNCSPMCIFGKRMAAGFSFNCRKQDGSWLYQPWRVGTGQELWLWWTINECCMWMKRRALWPHNLSSPLPQQRVTTSRPTAGGVTATLCGKKADLSQIHYMLFMCRWIWQKHVKIKFYPK